jgi:hypothetical protein
MESALGIPHAQDAPSPVEIERKITRVTANYGTGFVGMD